MRASTPLILLPIIFSYLVWGACAPAGRKEDLRGQSRAFTLESDNRLPGGDATAQGVSDVAAIPNLQTLEYGGEATGSLEGLKLMNFYPDRSLIVFFRDGRSLYFPPEGFPDAAVTLSPTVIPPPGGSLYTLPAGEFWLVSPDEIGRRRNDPSLDPSLIPIERIPTQSFRGDRSQIRALFAEKDEIMLALGTHVCIYQAVTGQLVQFELQKLPVALQAPVVAGGKTADGAYWLATRDAVAVALPVGGRYIWKKFSLTLGENPSTFEFLAMLPQSQLNSPFREFLIFTDGRLWGPAS